mmetsp:Transcript_41266/g.136746  ORF Transcript_41266/g.136746 Transcript_41266/m.136746 type:complete len:178 (+) Transcript_41266:1364-1897(+)
MLLVKFVASVIVIISGSGAVVRSGNDFDLIVNSLAAVFIVDIPALAYKVFLPPAFKRLIQDMPPFSNPAREEAKKCTCKSLINRCSSAIAAKVRIAFVALYIYIYFALCVCISYLLVQIRWCGGWDSCPWWLAWLCKGTYWCWFDDVAQNAGLNSSLLGDSDLCVFPPPPAPSAPPP